MVPLYYSKLSWLQCARVSWQNSLALWCLALPVLLRQNCMWATSLYCSPGLTVQQPYETSSHSSTSYTLCLGWYWQHVTPVPSTGLHYITVLNTTICTYSRQLAILIMKSSPHTQTLWYLTSSICWRVRVNPPGPLVLTFKFGKRCPALSHIWDSQFLSPLQSPVKQNL
jgi:hypothetical protein